MNPGRGRTGAGSAGGAPSVARRSVVLAVIFCLLFGVIGLRLFQLQILRGEQYSQRAYAQHTIVENIPAKRGEILVREEGSDTLVKMATNTTLDLVFVDPSQTPDRAKVAAFLAKTAVHGRAPRRLRGASRRLPRRQRKNHHARAAARR